jgi:DNA helicase-2/ATP-dependent DNA helicase PcrA
MTRAKNELDLIVPQRFFRYQQAEFDDRHLYGAVTRFIPTSIRDAFDCRTWREQTTTVPDTRARALQSSVGTLAGVG